MTDHQPQNTAAAFVCSKSPEDAKPPVREISQQTNDLSSAAFTNVHPAGNSVDRNGSDKLRRLLSSRIYDGGATFNNASGDQLQNTAVRFAHYKSPENDMPLVSSQQTNVLSSAVITKVHRGGNSVDRNVSDKLRRLLSCRLYDAGATFNNATGDRLQNTAVEECTQPTNALSSAVISNVHRGGNSVNMRSNNDVLCNLTASHSRDAPETLVSAEETSRVQPVPDKTHYLLADNTHHLINLGVSRERNYRCSMCSKAFFMPSCLRKHERQVHSNERPYVCDICHKTFKVLSTLNGHKLTHTKDRPRPFVCNVCSMAFHEITTLNKHKRVHTKERPYECDICHNRYTGLCNLKRHILRHTGEKSFICDVCAKAFYSSKELKEHQKIHTNEKKICRYFCDTCNKGFTAPTCLKAHMSIHTGERPFACEVCSKAFRTYAILTAHNRTHTKEKPYPCTVCHKKFAQPHHLDQHKQTHANAKAFSCDVCGLRFNHPNKCNQHKKLAHP